MSDKPQWDLDITWHPDDTIATVRFGIQTYTEMTAVEDAVTQLAAVIRWWLDTKQYIHPALAAEGA